MRTLLPTCLIGLTLLAACAGPGDPVLVEEPTPEPPTPAFTLSLPGDSTLAIVTNELFITVVDIARAPDFAGTLTFSATAPEGLIVIFRPAAVIREVTDVLVIAEAGVPVGRHTVTIRAQAPGGAVQSVELLVDVTAEGS